MNNRLLSIITITLLLFQSIVNAQSLNLINNSTNELTIELSVIKNSESELTSKEHEYYLKATNNSNNNVEVRITAENTICKGKVNVVPFIQTLYIDKTSAEINENYTAITIQPNSSVSFYMKLINTSDNILNSWNCTEVKAFGTNNEILSNTLLIESFIPNPNDFK